MTISGQMGLPASEILTSGVLPVVSVNEQQSHGGSLPVLCFFHRKASDQGDDILKTTPADLFPGTLTDGRVSEVESTSTASGCSPVPRQVVRINGPHLRPHPCLSPCRKPARGCSLVGTQLHNGLIVRHRTGQLVQGFHTVHRGQRVQTLQVLGLLT